MNRTPRSTVVLLAALAFAGCGALCTREDTYAGADLVPFANGATAAQVLALSRMHLAASRTWVPDPSEHDSVFGTTLPLPYEGSVTDLEIDVEPVGTSLHRKHSYDLEYGCDPGPVEGRVRIRLRSSDGVLNEELEGKLLPLGPDRVQVDATLREPKGQLATYFDAYEAPNYPEVQIHIVPEAFSLRLAVRQRRDGGESWSYVTLL